MKLDKVVIMMPKEIPIIVLDSEKEQEAWKLWLEAYVASTATPDPELYACYLALKEKSEALS